MHRRAPARGVELAEGLGSPIMSDGQTVGRRWRARRDAVLYAAHRQGIPREVLADVFDLGKTRTLGIIREMDARAGQLGDDQAERGR